MKHLSTQREVEWRCFHLLKQSMKKSSKVSLNLFKTYLVLQYLKSTKCYPISFYNNVLTWTVLTARWQKKTTIQSLYNNVSAWTGLTAGWHKMRRNPHRQSCSFFPTLNIIFFIRNFQKFTDQEEKQMQTKKRSRLTQQAVWSAKNPRIIFH